MGLRFNRRVKICKGVSLNFGKKGTSISVGTKRARATFGKDGVRTTVGIPGTGISYTDYKKYNNDKTNNKIKNKVKNRIEDLNIKASKVKDKTLFKEYKKFIIMLLLGMFSFVIALFKIEFFFLSLIFTISALVYMLVFNKRVFECQCAIFYYNQNEYNKSLKYCNKVLNKNANEKLKDKAKEIINNLGYN